MLRGFGDPAAESQHRGEVEPRVRVQRIEPQGLPVARLRALEVAAAAQGEAEVGLGRRQERIVARGVQELALRPLTISGPEQHRPEVAACLPEARSCQERCLERLTRLLQAAVVGETKPEGVPGRGQARIAGHRFPEGDLGGGCESRAAVRLSEEEVGGGASWRGGGRRGQGRGRLREPSAAQRLEAGGEVRLAKGEEVGFLQAVRDEQAGLARA